MPEHFEKNKEKYAEVAATVFADCEQGELLHWIFGGNWDELAAHFVDL